MSSFSIASGFKQFSFSSRWFLLAFLYLTTFVFNFTSILHESNFAFVTSYLFGDEATQFGLVLFCVFFGMMVGSFFFRFVPDKYLITIFIAGEVLLTFLSGFSIVIGFWIYAHTESYVLPIWAIILLISSLVGFEDACLMRFATLREKEVKQAISFTMGAASLGSAMAGALFGQMIPLFRGSLNIALFLGLLDGAFVVFSLFLFRKEIRKTVFLIYLVLTIAILSMLYASFTHSDFVSSSIISGEYNDSIISRWETPYGDIVITRNEHGNHRLYMNGALQLSTSDEDQYHESLAHPAMSLALSRNNRPLNILVFGGGDGFLTRELLKYPQAASITVVDLNPTMTNVVAKSEPLVTYNNRSFFDKRVHIINQDAFLYSRSMTDLYDVVYVDLVDPDTIQGAKLYSDQFYHYIGSHLTPGGIMVTQSTSPWYSGTAFWDINNTLRTVFPTVIPYHVAIPSFGDWGFNIASNMPFEPRDIQIPTSIHGKQLHWLTTDAWLASLSFGKSLLEKRDYVYSHNIVNTISDLNIVYYYTHDNRWDDEE